jgi:hypothetical protein
MKKAVKILIISLVLLIPVIVTIFLNIFGDNQYEIPVYHINGNPVEECHKGDEQHTISDDFIDQYNLSLPALITISQSTKNLPEFDNVLLKYPGVSHFIISKEKMSSNYSMILLDSVVYLKVINCELVIGENEWLDKPIENKSVLIDKEKRIRGYYFLTDIDEIERLDTEIDILINF